MNNDFYDVAQNEHGHPQTYQRGSVTEEDHTVCACCHAAVMPNRGQGSACEQCQHEHLLECQHDYDTGAL